ncbi:unnamed protein product [Clavelina lepadiformis]|uniref:Metalloendopeptidase n=1 Tax=Clavelina lepadiformis TaxID=159417 RepID=A0ABP0FIB7_CLALP
MGEEDFLEIVRGRKGCSSFIGRRGGRQVVSIGKNCDRVGIIIHELMHALGFWHEQSRPDRDEHITIHLDDIKSEYHHNFKSRGRDSVRSFNSSYDFGSVMHYNGYSFSSNGNPTVLIKNSQQPVKAQRHGLSIEDLYEINKLYLCSTNSSVTVKQLGDHWGLWSTWQTCSSSCGEGYNVRQRECLDSSDVIVYYGRCPGLSFEMKTCETGPCEQGKWGMWSPCSASCGVGIRRRQSCCYPNIKYVRQSCSADPCPRDSTTAWTEWQEWGMCSRPCGTGWRKRNRRCIDSSSGNIVGVRSCPWKLPGATELVACATEHCNETTEVIGQWDKWQDWGSCSQTCGKGVQFRSRDCLGDLPGYGNCTGDEDDMRLCNLTSCPVIEKNFTIANWGPWSGWSLCSVTCGQGLQKRERTCYGRKYSVRQDCYAKGVKKEIDSEEKICEESCRAVSRRSAVYNKDDLSSHWSTWTLWGKCTKSCASGIQWRRRKCLNGKTDDAGCEGIPVNTQLCNTFPCVAKSQSRASGRAEPSHEAHWTVWTTWSQCSQTCGFSLSRRFRKCINGRVGQQGCGYTLRSGVKLGGFEERYCVKNPCNPDLYKWSTWTSWTRCSRFCKGTRWRQRQYECVSHSPCFIQPINTVDKVAEACNKACGWSSWGNWGKCSGSCGSGTKIRRRVCESGYGCAGMSLEAVACRKLCFLVGAQDESDYDKVIKGRSDYGEERSFAGDGRFCPTSPMTLTDYDNDGLDDLLCLYSPIDLSNYLDSELESRSFNTTRTEVAFALNRDNGSYFETDPIEISYLMDVLHVVCFPNLLQNNTNITGNSRFDQLLAINYYDASSSLYDYEEAQYARYRRQYMRRGVVNKGICDNTVRYDKYQFAGNKRIKLLTMAEYTGDHVFCFESDGVTLTSAFWNLNLDVDWYEYDYNVNLSLTKVREDLNEPFKHFDESYREALLNKDPLENGFPINNLIAGTRRDPLK